MNAGRMPANRVTTLMNGSTVTIQAEEAGL
jgi:hypothetical protein